MSWRPPDDLRGRWTENEFALEFSAWHALTNGRLSGAGLGTHEGRIDMRAFDTPPGWRPVKSGILRTLVEARETSPPTSWSNPRGLRIGGVDFSHARIPGRTWSNVVFEDCVFDRAELDGRFQDCSFRDCSFVRANVGGARLGDYLNPDRWMPCSFENCSFEKASMTSTYWIGSTLRNCDFSNARMKHSEWIAVAVENCHFAGTISEAAFRAEGWQMNGRARSGMLDGVDFSQATLDWVEFVGLDLRKTRFPAGDEDLVVSRVRCFLEAVLSQLDGKNDASARFGQQVIPKQIDRIGPDQQQGYFNLKNWFSLDDDAFGTMRASFDSAKSVCS